VRFARFRDGVGLRPTASFDRAVAEFARLEIRIERILTEYERSTSFIAPMLWANGDRREDPAERGTQKTHVT